MKRKRREKRREDGEESGWESEERRNGGPREIVRLKENIEKEM